MNLSDINNNLLKDYLKKRYKEATVILCFLILLRNVIQNGESATMSKIEVEKRFNSIHQNFGINTFRRDYLKRQSGDPQNAIDENKSQEFFIREDFLSGIDKEQMMLIDERITNFYESKFSKNLAFIDAIEELIEENDTEKIFKYVESFLRNDLMNGDRRGQNFEIVSFAILKQFYVMRGFRLNRFSTTFANDGGMDFIGEEAIYQATVIMNLKKFKEDIIKTPQRKRIIVYKKLSSNFDKSLFTNPLILDTIDIEKLYDHLLYIKNAANKDFLREILEVIKDEFNREFMAITTEIET